MNLLPGVKADSALSGDGVYRYSLTREWAEPARPQWVAWIMLNPSTADAVTDDATLRKIQKFSMTWAFDGLLVVNLFALRATRPKHLRAHPDPVGPANDAAIRTALRSARVHSIVAAWGVNGALHGRDAVVCNMAAVAGRPLHALRLTKRGFPEHPLYVPDSTVPGSWSPAR